MDSSATADYHQIDDFLLAKVKDALAEVLRTTAKHLPAKLYGISSIFNDLMNKFLEAEGPKQTREKLYKLDNLLDEWKNHSKKKNHYCSVNFFSNFKKELTKIQEEFATSNGLQPTLRVEEEVEPILREEEVKDFRWSNRLVDVKKVYGIHDKVMSLQQFLVSRRESDESDDRSRFSMIGLVGVRGIGKTTMAQVVFDKPEVKKHFLPRIWVCASKQSEALLDGFDPRIEIVKRMLMCLGLEEEVVESAQGHGLKGLLCTLRLQLRGKRYLIVLDDVWCKYEEEGKAFSTFCSSLEKDESKYSEKLAYGLPKGYGGAVIVTSRIKKLAMDMVGEENLHTVKLLKDPFSCWNIFKDSARQIDEQAEDQEVPSVEDATAYDNGHVDEREDHGEVISASYNGHVDEIEDHGEVISASDNGHVDQQQRQNHPSDSADDSASANGHIDQQEEQNQNEEDSAPAANGEEEKPVEDSTDGRRRTQVVEISAKQEDDPLEQRFKEMKNRIIQKCGGLPLAARMLGEIARESRKNETGEPESGPREQEEAAENPQEPETTRSEEPHDLED